jgi:hypothetical protein
MLAALGTLPFLATLWLLAVLGVKVLEESGAKIAAALKGMPGRRPGFRSLRVRTRTGLKRPRRVETRWRAAA